MRKFRGAAIDPLLIGEATGKVDTLYEIENEGIYEVKGFDCPVSVESCTEYGADYLREQGYRVIHGMSMIPFGEWVE